LKCNPSIKVALPFHKRGSEIKRRDRETGKNTRE
jgi:hypothetical protein